MFGRNPTIVVADASVASSSGLVFIDQISDPIKLHKQHKMGDTREARFSRMLKMKTPALASYFTHLQKPRSLSTMKLQKSNSLNQTLHTDTSDDESYSVEVAFRRKKQQLFHQQQKGTLDTKALYMSQQDIKDNVFQGVQEAKDNTALVRNKIREEKVFLLKVQQDKKDRDALEELSIRYEE